MFVKAVTAFGHHGGGTMTKRLIGLDGEMSDSELADGAVLVQIGVAFDATERFSAILGWPEDSYFRTDRAMAVHGIHPVAIAAADPPAEVDVQLEQWLLARGAASEKRALVPVGYNVGAFDLPFVAAFLPRTSQLLSRRVVDLNAFCLAYEGRVPYQGSLPSFSGWKRLAQRYAAEKLAAVGLEENLHDAGYDAASAIVQVEFFTSLVGR
jgi:hypothetical protein